MKNRIGNDITFTWHIFRKSGETQTPESFDGKDVEVKLISPLQRPVTIEDVSIATGVVTFTFRGKHQVTLGNYVAILQENRGEDGMVTLDVVNAVTLVPHSYMEEDGDEGDVIEAESVEQTSTISAGGGGSQEQADWDETNTTSPAYIKHKPNLGEYVKKVSETKQTIHSGIDVDGLLESHDQYVREGISGWTHQIETIRSQGEITISNVNYDANGEVQTSRKLIMYGYRTGRNPGSGLSVISYYVLSSILLPYAEIELREDVYLRRRNNDGTYTEHYLSHKQNVINDLQTIREGATAGSTAVQPESLASLVNTGTYNSVSKKIELKHDNTILAEIDATAFIKDGMVNSVVIENGYIVITFNTDAGKEPISIPLTDIFNPANYYTKTQVDMALSGKASTQELSGKEDKMPIVQVASGTTAINAAVNTYYEVAGTVGTLAITLPVPSATDKLTTVVLHLTTGATPNVVIGSTATVDKFSSYAIEANKEYEINCAYNGDKWIVADMEVV